MREALAYLGFERWTTGPVGFWWGCFVVIASTTVFGKFYRLALFGLLCWILNAAGCI